MSCGTSGPSTSASPARTKSPACTRKCLPCETRCSRSMPLSLRTMIVRLPRRFSPSSSTVPSISAMTAGSFGLRASKISVTRGRPPVMSCVPDDLARRLGQQRAGRDHARLRRLRCGPFRAGSRSRGSCRSASSRTICGCRSPLCSMIDAADVTAGVLLHAHRLAFDRRLRSGPCRRLRPGSGCCAGPTGRAPCPALTSWFSSTIRIGAGGHLVLLQLAALGVEDRDFAVARRARPACPRRCVTTFMPGELDDAAASWRLISLSSTRGLAVPPMWNVRIVSCVPGSPMLCAAMMPTAMPSSTSAPVERSMP